jgi:hypothetical protein
MHACLCQSSNRGKPPIVCSLYPGSVNVSDCIVLCCLTNPFFCYLYTYRVACVEELSNFSTTKVPVFLHHPCFTFAIDPHRTLSLSMRAVTPPGEVAIEEVAVRCANRPPPSTTFWLPNRGGSSIPYYRNFQACSRGCAR